MKIDKRTVPSYSKGVCSHIGLKTEYMFDTDFRSGDDIIVIYEKDKITVVKEITGVIMVQSTSQIQGEIEN